MTNNSTKSRVDYLQKLHSLSIPSNVEDIFSSSYSAAIYISRILKFPNPNKRKVFIIGETGIEQELRSENISFIGGTDPSLRRDITPQDYKLMASADPSLIDPEVGVVLTGLDFHINYLKISLAYHYIRFHGAVFLATNMDSTLPSGGSFFAGAGAISAPLIKMLGGQEPTAFGKPSQAMMDAIEGKFKLDRSKTCMVGDRVDTERPPPPAHPHPAPLPGAHRSCTSTRVDVEALPLQATAALLLPCMKNMWWMVSV